MSKRAIVLGGAGLIGSHLCIRLLMEGYDVICIDKRSRRDSPLLRNIENRNRFHYIKHDVTEPYEIGCDEVYNLVSPVEYGDNYDYVEDQRLLPLSVINSLRNTVDSKTKVLFGSADDVYNFNNQEIEYSSARRFISESRRFGESMHKAYNLQYNTDIRIARIFSTYGTGMGLRDQHVVCKMIIDALNNNNITIYGNGEQVRTFCWVDDIVDGLIALMKAHNPGGTTTMDLGSDYQISIRNLAQMIISLTGSKSNIHHIAARVEEPMYKIPELSKSKNMLNWTPMTTLKDGLLRTISYIEKELSTAAISSMSWIEIYG